MKKRSNPAVQPNSQKKCETPLRDVGSRSCKGPGVAGAVRGLARTDDSERKSEVLPDSGVRKINISRRASPLDLFGPYLPFPLVFRLSSSEPLVQLLFLVCPLTFAPTTDLKKKVSRKHRRLARTQVSQGSLSDWQRCLRGTILRFSIPSAFYYYYTCCYHQDLNQAA